MVSTAKRTGKYSLRKKPTDLTPFTQVHKNSELTWLEKGGQNGGATTKEQIEDALDEYARLFKAGIASNAEKLTLARAFPDAPTYTSAIKDISPESVMVVGGPASVAMVDKEGHLITTNALEKAFGKYMDNFRTRNAMVLHSDVQVGWALPAYITKGGQIYKSGIQGKELFFICELRNDTRIAERVAKQIEDGKLRSYSIAGSATKVQNVQKGLIPYMQVDDMELAEVTVCEKGVNQGASFQILKAQTGKIDKEQAGYRPATEIEITNKIMCGTCKYYNGDDKTCESVDGIFEDTDYCKLFEAEEKEPELEQHAALIARPPKIKVRLILSDDGQKIDFNRTLQDLVQNPEWSTSEVQTQRDWVDLTKEDRSMSMTERLIKLYKQGGQIGFDTPSKIAPSKTAELQPPMKGKGAAALGGAVNPAMGNPSLELAEEVEKEIPTQSVSEAVRQSYSKPSLIHDVESKPYYAGSDKWPTGTSDKRNPGDRTNPTATNPRGSKRSRTVPFAQRSPLVQRPPGEMVPGPSEGVDETGKTVWTAANNPISDAQRKTWRDARTQGGTIPDTKADRDLSYLDKKPKGTMSGTGYQAGGHGSTTPLQMLLKIHDKSPEGTPSSEFNPANREGEPPSDDLIQHLMSEDTWKDLSLDQKRAVLRMVNASARRDDAPDPRTAEDIPDSSRRRAQIYRRKPSPTLQEQPLTEVRSARSSGTTSSAPDEDVPGRQRRSNLLGAGSGIPPTATRRYGKEGEPKERGSRETVRANMAHAIREQTAGGRRKPQSIADRFDVQSPTRGPGAGNELTRRVNTEMARRKAGATLTESEAQADKGIFQNSLIKRFLKLYKADSDPMKTGEAFTTLENTEARMKEHEQLLREYGFPEELGAEAARVIPVVEIETDDKGVPIHMKGPWTVNEAGQEAGEILDEMAPSFSGSEKAHNREGKKTASVSKSYFLNPPAVPFMSKRSM